SRDQSEERREQAHDHPRPWPEHRREGALCGEHAIRHRERDDRERADAADERERLDLATHEPALPTGAEDGRERLVERTVDRAGGEDRSDDAEAQVDRAAVDELPCDTRLLCRRPRIDVADELNELLLRPLRPVDEAKDADDEREERDEREEQLV